MGLPPLAPSHNPNHMGLSAHDGGRERDGLERLIWKTEDRDFSMSKARMENIIIIICNTVEYFVRFLHVYKTHKVEGMFSVLLKTLIVYETSK